jgi:hypothetical protein
MPRADASRKHCAIYTRKSSEEGLEQEFNSLAAQREASEAFIRSQQHEGWVLARTRYDDGGFSGGNLQRPALQHLLADVRAGPIDIVVVYKVDRLTRDLRGAEWVRLEPLIPGRHLAGDRARERHASGDERHSLAAADRLPLALPATRRVSATLGEEPQGPRHGRHRRTTDAGRRLLGRLCRFSPRQRRRFPWP